MDSPALADIPTVMALGVAYQSTPLAEGASQNVIDRYKGWEAKSIQEDLDGTRGEMVSVFQNLANDFNKATALRSHNAMGGKLCIFTGKRKYDKRGTVGQHNYTHAIFIEDTVEAVRGLQADGYMVYAVDNSPWMNPQPLTTAVLPLKSAFVYGEEGLGLPPEVVETCDQAIYIPMAGSVRSLNVASCAAMVMYAYGLQHGIRESQ